MSLSEELQIVALNIVVTCYDYSLLNPSTLKGFGALSKFICVNSSITSPATISYSELTKPHLSATRKSTIPNNAEPKSCTATRCWIDGIASICPLVLDSQLFCLKDSRRNGLAPLSYSLLLPFIIMLEKKYSISKIVGSANPKQSKTHVKTPSNQTTFSHRSRALLPQLLKTKDVIDIIQPKIS